MIDADNWEQQQGGLYLAVSPFEKTNPKHMSSAEDLVRLVVRTVASSHGALFNEEGFCDNMRALCAGDIRADFFLAKWDLCNSKPVYLGLALNWDTYGIDSRGAIRRARYMEDECVLTSKLRQLIRERPEGKALPEEGIGACFERINLRNMLIRDGIWYRYGEVDRNNAAIIGTLDRNKTVLGTGPDSAVLEFRRLSNDLSGLPPKEVKVVEIGRNGAKDNNNFIVRWGNAVQDIRFIVTKGQATAIGCPRIDIRSWHNGNLPEQIVLKHVVTSSLQTILQESSRRKWNKIGRDFFSNTTISWLDDHYETSSIRQRNCVNEVAVIPEVHAHIINDQRVLNAFMAAGAETRLFGNRPMIPGISILKEENRLVT